MRILVLGGTVFLGRHVVEAAVARGHAVTLFNRGVSHPDAFPAVEQVHGDREWDLERLGDRSFDAVIDTSGYLPRIVRKGLGILRPLASHYTFVSTVSVYKEFRAGGVREDSAVAELSRADSEDIQADYGALKFLCEEAVRDVYGHHALVVRPGLIVGPWDPTDRFTYWPYRIGRGGDVLVPGRPERRIQFIDGRDLAAWIVRMVEAGAAGTYNATGPEPGTTMGDLVDACVAVAGTAVRTHWVSDDFLVAHRVGEWMDLPLWIRDTPEQAGFYDVDCAKALAASLTFRLLFATVGDTLAWHQTREPYLWKKTGLDPTREHQLITAWETADG